MAREPDEEPVLTPAAQERLKAELQELTTVGRRDVAARLRRARELGDIQENSEYHATKEEQGLMEARIRKLEWTLKHAQVLEAPVEANEVVPGVIVIVQPAGADAGEEAYLIAASPEERARGARTVTVKSPLGSVLVGKRPGDRVSYEAPGGSFTYEVVAVRPWDGS